VEWKKAGRKERVAEEEEEQKKKEEEEEKGEALCQAVNEVEE
jgi:hypothetical protein